MPEILNQMKKAPSDWFDFSAVTVATNPFPHFATPSFVEEGLGLSLLSWFETEAKWATHNQDGFYDSFDLSLRESDLPSDLMVLTSQPLTEYFRWQISQLFGAHLSDRVDVTAHKLISQYRIGIHTDYGETKQTHRLLVQINRGWKADLGGLLMFLMSKTPSDLTEHDRIFVPHHRCGVCFEVSPKSFHAVSPVKTGTRYTLCYSFYGQH